jgi:hypothetical protein
LLAGQLSPTQRPGETSGKRWHGLHAAFAPSL